MKKRVVVVGAGVAGLAAAIELAEKGHRVTLLFMGHHLGRNRSHHERFLLTEPGTARFRPRTRALPLKNLYLAGDWIRSDLDFPCMEAAIRTGFAAAAAIMEDG